MKQETSSQPRQVFNSQSAFIMAAVGSAVGLGNIWRFPYVAYENGGGAFILPYLIALLTVGIPFLFLDYSIGHKFRSSSPLNFRLLNRGTEPIGWVHAGIAFVIAIYYAVIIAWAICYTFFSLNQTWGDDAETFFGSTFLQQSQEATFSLQPVTGVLLPLIAVWVITLFILVGGVQNGIARVSKIFLPVLMVLFVGLVIRSLTLPGAAEGLDAFFSPNFSALADPKVWIAAYGQIFFSLSVAFGIMITYASYLKPRTNLTGSGLVVGFANSSFEILAGIGVFAALGFMAHQNGVAISETVAGGPGLAFIAFPSLISQMPGGSIFGILFFLSLVFAGLTSLISLVQVVTAAVADKLGISLKTSTIVFGGVMAVASCILYPTITGLSVLDVVDAFVNNLGIVGIALIVLICLAWIIRALPMLRDHLNKVSSFKVGWVWMALLGVVTPLVLGYMFISSTYDMASNGYGEYPGWFVGVFGWGMVAGLVVFAVVLSLIPWRKGTVEAARAHHDEAQEEISSADNQGDPA
ncbi:sodium-dependent transporter [Brevibacterium paucivorans]|uniref:Transporter n=1 Tax=Brevibacterium paucivorans TaxID=170994 RepID=A0A2N6VM10_9MICO|nr:sodium-dependent transporter [Brevibacterium paucivorans]PMD05117.1 sodium-dependent transporter [Brevibacterium paucivorans]